MTKTKFFSLIQAVVLLSVSVPTQASEFNGSEFIDWCRKARNYNDPDNNIRSAYCMGVMGGLRAANLVFRTAKSKHAFCEPEHYTNMELAESFIAIAEKNPKIRELSGALAAQAALYEAFPCKYD